MREQTFELLAVEFPCALMEFLTSGGQERP